MKVRRPRQTVLACAQPNPLLRRNDGASPIRRIRRDAPIRHPDINQRLHRFHVPRAHQPKQLHNRNEVHKARVQIRPPTSIAVRNVPERVHPVRVVQVPVDAEELAEDSFDVVEERLGEAGGFADPVAACELGKGRVEGRWAGGDGGPGRGGEVDVVEAGVRLCRGHGGERWVRGEDARVVDLADDPALHELDVVHGGNFDGLFVAIEPGVDVVAGRGESQWGLLRLKGLEMVGGE